jgi:hypothetical protein
MSTTRWIAALAGLAVAQFVVSTNLAGQAAPPPQFDYSTYSQIGAGGSGCGAMTKNLAADRERYLVPYLFWEQGFLTGVNFASFRDRQDDPRVGKDVGPDELLAALEQFCGANPSLTVGDAASLVYTQLAGR